jgi:hypothetical protein
LVFVSSHPFLFAKLFCTSCRHSYVFHVVGSCGELFRRLFSLSFSFHSQVQLETVIDVGDLSDVGTAKENLILLKQGLKLMSILKEMYFMVIVGALFVYFTFESYFMSMN